MALLIVFISFFGFFPAHGQGPKTATAKPLARLTQLALENSPIIASARRNYESSTLEKKNSFASMLPSLDLEAVHGYEDSNPVNRDNPTRPWQSSLGLTLSEKFYDNGASISRYKLNRRKEQRTLLEFELSRDEHLSKVAQAYFTWSEQAQMRLIEETRHDLLRKQFRQVGGQFRQGMRTKRDVLRIETRLRSSELELVKSANDVRLAEEELASLVGVSVDVLGQEGIGTMEPNPKFMPLEISEPLATTTHRRTKALDLALQESQLETEIVRREYWPQLYLDGKVNYGTQGYMNSEARMWDNDILSWSTLLTLKYNIFDFGINRREVQMARIRTEQVGDENRRTLLELKQELTTVFTRLKEMRETLKLSQELLGLEQSSYNRLERDYRDGRAEYLELIENLDTLIDAKSRYISSYFGFKTQQVNYEFHQGRVQEFLMAQ